MRLWTYTVSGSGHFPYDMLRYDQCWPKDTSDVYNMEPYEKSHVRQIYLSSFKEPTRGRWLSFGWKVTWEKLEVSE